MKGGPSEAAVRSALASADAGNALLLVLNGYANDRYRYNVTQGAGREALAAVEPIIRADEREKVVLEYVKNAEQKVAAAVRADQTRRIVEWVRYAAGHIRTMSKEQACTDMADAIAREFGGSDHAE